MNKSIALTAFTWTLGLIGVQSAVSQPSSAERTGAKVLKEAAAKVVKYEARTAPTSAREVTLADGTLLSELDYTEVKEESLGFNHKALLPKGFDALATEDLAKSPVSFVENDAVELGFDHKAHLPKGFDPYTKVKAKKANVKSCRAKADKKDETIF